MKMTVSVTCNSNTLTNTNQTADKDGNKKHCV